MSVIVIIVVSAVVSLVIALSVLVWRKRKVVIMQPGQTILPMTHMGQTFQPVAAGPQVIVPQGPRLTVVNGPGNQSRMLVTLVLRPEDFEDSEDEEVEMPDQSVFWRIDQHAEYPQHEQMCSICLETVADRERSQVGQAKCCESWFHRDCIDQYWNLSRMPRCPNCRHDMV
jgi:hypothetical protein